VLLVLLMLQTLDGDYYEKLREFLTSLAGTEQTCANTANDCYQQVMDNASKVHFPLTVSLIKQKIRNCAAP